MSPPDTTAARLYPAHAVYSRHQNLAPLHQSLQGSRRVTKSKDGTDADQLGTIGRGQVFSANMNCGILPDVPPTSTSRIAGSGSLVAL